MTYRKFDKYGIVKRIAIGGISEIFLAREDQGKGLLDRHVVIKKLLPQFSGNEKLASIIQREARLLAALYHANIVQVVDAGITEENEPYLVLEYIQGQDLKAVYNVAHEGRTPLAPSMVYFILEQTLRALVHMHELKDPKGRPYHLIHRDLSPTNIMCSMSGDVKILDFGLAKRALDVTGSGNLTGKVPYLSPEQITGGRVDARSDLFALGTVFYEICTGRHRYEGTHDVEILQKIRDRADEPLSRVAGSFPPELIAVIQKACEYEPHRRPTGAREMLTELSALPAVVPGLHGGRNELVDFMEFHFGATRIDSTLPVVVSGEKPVAVHSFNLASLEMPSIEDMGVAEAPPDAPRPAQRPAARPSPVVSGSSDWFEPLSPMPGSEHPAIEQKPAPPAERHAPASAPSGELPETVAGYKHPATEPVEDVTRQGWKQAAGPDPTPPIACAPAAAGPPPGPPSGIRATLTPPAARRPTGAQPVIGGQAVLPGPQVPGTGPKGPQVPKGPPPGIRATLTPPGPPPGPPPGIRATLTPPGPPPGPPPAARRPTGSLPSMPPHRSAVPPDVNRGIMDVTAPVPPLDFDGFEDETHYLPSEGPDRKAGVDLGGTWFAHPVIRVGVPVGGLVLLLVAAWFLFWPNSSKTGPILITLQGDGQETQVYLDNAPLGSLPVTFRFPADGDSHEVRVEAPRKLTWKRTLQPSNVKTETIVVKMEPLLAELKLVSSKPGVEIRVNRDGKKAADIDEWIPLPLILEGLEPGLTLQVEARWKKKKWDMPILVPAATFVEISVEPPSTGR